MSALLSRALTALTVALLLAAAAIGALGGVRLGEAMSEPGTRTVEVTHPDSRASDAAPSSDAPARSAAGFTGFGGAPALRGDVLRTGTVQSVRGSEVLVTAEGSTAALRYTSTGRFFRITPSTSDALRPGEAVQLRIEDGRVAGVLKLPAGLDQGSNR